MSLRLSPVRVRARRLLLLPLAVSAGAAEVRVAPPPRLVPPPAVVPPPRGVPRPPVVSARGGAAAPQVEIFVADWCPHCRALESALSARGIRFARRDIEADPAAKLRYEQLGQTGLPVTRVGSRVIVGNRLDDILDAIRHPG